MAGAIAFPVVKNDLNNIIVSTNAEDAVKNLFENFDDPFTTGVVAQFELAPASFNGAITEVLLFDQPGAGAPLTVENFLNYLNGGDYTNTIIHRSFSDPSLSVIQGGGFAIDGLTTPSDVGVITPDAPISNEFSSERSNLRGTLAMAKPENDPDGATNQWFFNLADNSTNLDNQNGGFTVFGEVLSDKDLETIDAIGNLPVFDTRSIFGLEALGNIPLIFPDDNATITGDDNFVRYSSITVTQRDELTFSIIDNSNPQLVNASIIDNELILDYVPEQLGTADITVQATNLLGEVVEDTFSVTVSDSDLVGTTENDEILGSADNNTLLGRPGDDFLFGRPGDDILRGGRGNDTLSSGRGDDELYGGDDDDILLGRLGDDFLSGGKGNDELDGGDGNDSLLGQLGDDNLIGGTGLDVLSGGRGVDILDGADGDDILAGGLGRDTLTGGEGSDTFRYLAFSQSLLSDGAVETLDIITDLVIGTDQIDSLNAVSAASVLQASDAATLDEANIQAILAEDFFSAGGAATFTSNSRTFLALNDSAAGYQQASDALIEITGYSGDLANLEIV